MNIDKELLFKDNTKLVHYIIHNKFQGFETYIPGYEYEDIMQVGNIGLWKACMTFNPNKGIAFSTYASRLITNEILMAIRQNKNRILNNSLSLNDIVEDGEGGETELGNILIANDDNNQFSISELKTYINDKYKDSEIKLNIVNSYIFEGLSQYEIGKKYKYSQAQVSRILRKFKLSLKNDIERNGSL